MSMETLGIVSITVPNFLHREIGSAFAAAGKHIWIEKPVGLSADDARAIVGDGQVTVGFNFRNAPAVETARDLIAGGEIGRVTHARVRLFSDYAAHPPGALSWTRRCAPSSSGPGRRLRSVPAGRRKRDPESSGPPASCARSRTVRPGARRWPMRSRAPKPWTR